MDTLKVQLEAAMPNLVTRVTAFLVACVVLAILAAIIFLKKQQADEGVGL